MKNRATEWLARKLAPWAARVIRSRNPDFRTKASDGRDAMRRWRVFESRLGNLYIHEWRVDGGRIPHDHPYWSISLCVSGRLLEFVHLQARRSGLTYRPRVVHEGDLVARPATFSHRVKPVWPGAVTIFLTGPRIRQWGFWLEGEQGTVWRPWRDCVDPVDPGKMVSARA